MKRAFKLSSRRGQAMSRASRVILALFFILLVSRSGSFAAPDELSDLMARAEALYYEADFVKSMELLLRADDLLRPQAGRLKEKTDVKLLLALGSVGLNDMVRAKTYLGELYTLDPGHQLDPQMYSPKVIRLADDAKAEQEVLRCRTVADEAQKQLTAGNGDAVVKLISSNQAKCSGLSTLNSKAADVVFKEGLAAYKKAQMVEALQKFRQALVLEPKHELASQYVDLTQSKLEITAERTLLVWRKDFDAGDFALAARDYRELKSSSNAPALDGIREEYRRLLASMVDSWNKACAKDDSVEMERIRARVNALLPEPTFAEDILGKMKTCSPVGCIQMDAQLALKRLKYRVDPQFSAVVKSQVKESPVRVNL